MIVFDDYNSQISLLPAGVIIYVVLLIAAWRRKRRLSYLFCAAVFGIYLLAAVDKVFFPIWVRDVETFERFMSGINLVPFNFDLSYIPHLALMEIVLNVLLTVPFGFGVSFVARLEARHILRLALGVGLGIEGLQLFFSLLLRYPYRIIDINDVILNTTGVLIGYGIFRVFAYLYIWVTNRFSIRHGGLPAYVYDVVSRA